MKITVEITKNNKVEKFTINRKERNVNSTYAEFVKNHSNVVFSWRNGTRYIGEPTVLTKFKSSKVMDEEFSDMMKNDFKKYKNMIKW